MTTPTNPQPREVLQCDRDAAADMHFWYNGQRTAAEEAMRNGDYDSDDRVQAFAAHRQAAEASDQPGGREEIAKIIRQELWAEQNSGRDAEACADRAAERILALRAPRADIVP